MKILYFGPITPKGQPNIGGYEAANRKNIDKLREMGVDVEEFPNPVINHKLGMFGKLAYMKLFFTPFLLLRFITQKDIIVHTTPLYGNLLLPSLWLLCLAKLLRIRKLVDVRAGSLIHYYTTQGKCKRKGLRLMISLADKITVEGSSYIRDIKNVMGLNADISYFPNIALCRDFHYSQRAYDKINILYFGRITENKGVDTLLNMMYYLDMRFHLYLAGGIANDMHNVQLESPKITYLGLLKPEQLKDTMQRMHFFVFPTRHIGEGQSNSLIEAMSNGLVPVASDQGFNVEVIADCGFVLKSGSTGKDYADIIKKVDADSWNKLSRKCCEHICKFHNVDIEIPKLVEIYKNMLD
ncbi:MAG: glycosyltransferase family 4 protein [Prevotella sp.]|nr:glycosyltransferase family 4 protein [Prevotella sp.]